ncbi:MULTISPECIES: dethiobiotin synthase [unclassified Arcicella]|uniref:dethiobiotin synthase n=1 Tax=unclassified Arcicella TaxID=2644986 RepID=UPI002859FC0F|nr:MULTISPECIES: dethiobiotin synthase [unclassified Arcicella]MDR6560277.1 dethiobiotin synthetase [Arcicella sp. BE51]MDR6810117.1 dethiobiotin synthetase [Arcicella sp. BE140]MDR6821466.1 dethiobiotin synthetase [Arcicella sp. BE139]
MKQQYIIAGIGTEIGKTFIASILTESLEADYWKPVQSGALDFTDTNAVQSLVSNRKTIFHPEAYRLNEPLSPHAAAAIDGIEIQLSNFELPITDNNLIVELAGGLMVPLNKDTTNLDLIKQLNLPLILVSKNYLGSINHTLLSIEVLKSSNIDIKGIIFNGESNPSSEDYILNYTQVPLIGRVNQEQNISQETVKKYAEDFRKTLYH